MSATLPRPTAERWKPLRAGLIDVFYYDVEEFWFRDGRLLLRGNNGTGKSKVLALLLPFLLDADLSAHRVEPDADPRKRMEWNLLLGGVHPHPERVGYTWLEFGRCDSNGAEHYRTIGCGMKAVAGRGVTPWFFVTQARVGADLHLVDAHRTPLTKDRLTDALGEAGQRYDKARDYRRAVDETLFGLGEQRYGALVDLLIQLRQPQLSKRPTEAALSNALTESLPPLGQAILADVAEAFRSLEEDRVELADMREAMVVATAFLDHYRNYARVATRRKAEGARTTQSRYEKLGRELGDANRSHAAAVEELADVDARLESVRAEEANLLEHQRGLHDSKAMNASRDLENARQRAEKARSIAADLEVQREGAEADQIRLHQRFERAHSDLDKARDARTSARDAARRDALGAAVEASHAALDSRLDSNGATELRRATASLVARQKSAVEHIATRISAVENAHRDLLEARGRRTELDERAAELADRRTSADEAVSSAAADYLRATREHLTSATELVLGDLDDVLDELAEWAQTLGGDNPLVARAERYVRTVIEQLAREDADAGAAEAQYRDAVAELTAELARLEAGETAAPPRRHTVDIDVAHERTGAPLWRLVEFRLDLDESDRAGLEAALEAAGVLDAWVTGDGDLVTAGEVVVTSADPARGRTLADALSPALDPDAAVPAAAVAGILDAIGLGSQSTHHSWVDVAGTFRLGVLSGAWQKSEPQYVGAGAREAARRRRIALLHIDIEAAAARVAAVEAVRARLGRRRAVVDAEFEELPRDGNVRAAHEVLARLGQEFAALQIAVDKASAAIDVAHASHGARAVELEADALDSGLPIARDALTEIAERLGDYRVSAERLFATAEAFSAAAAAEEGARGDLERATARFAELQERVADERREADGAAEYVRTLHANVGAEVAQLQTALHQVAAELRANTLARKAAGVARDGWLEKRGRADEARRLLTEQIELAAAERSAATETLRHFASTGLIRVAAPDLDYPDPAEEWAPNPTVLLARSIDAALESVAYDEKTFERLQARVSAEHKSMGDVLSRQGNSTSAQPVGDSIVVDVMFRGKATTVPELAATLAAEVSDRSRLLSEREREILENHLVSEVASTLQELIATAEQHVARMNHELDARPTSTGMRLRLHWESREDAPPGAAIAWRQLRQTADAWNEADRSAVGGFLQGEIERVRADRVGGTWLEHLVEALDYRRWNRFVIKRHQNGQWRPAVGPSSGGEGALVASVPLFAAASAHYSSAGNPHAPRLVTLDEAFAGVDDNARAKYLGLLAAFDLDVVMTSEREWGCYREVPGLAIAHLSRIDGVDAVLVTNWEWDGQVRRPVDRAVPALAAAEVAEPSTQDGLWQTD
ncbi:TIGR02680 family protein [Antrihabitans sp. NCIMB 15449]|uniref:TIGR02680 family protein n=1 Tax=Antrihabitans spumae TaxID=3373370 RepID=A0ABW7JHQ1_9NOCA